MESWIQISGAGLYLCCFALSIASALMPWLNGEILLLALAPLARSTSDLVNLVLLASAGQMAGKCVLYWAGRGTRSFQSARVTRTLALWQERFSHSPSKPLALVFLSSALSIPPFYVVTILAGAFRLRFGSFLAVGACGRLIRFGVLVFVPAAAFRLLP